MKLKHFACLAAVTCPHMLSFGQGRSSLQVRWRQEYWGFDFRLSCEVRFTSKNHIPLCSLMLLEGSLPLTTSIIYFVSWFLVFPNKTCNFVKGIGRCVIFINETDSSDHHDCCRITCSWRGREATGTWQPQQCFLDLLLHTLLVKLNLSYVLHTSQLTKDWGVVTQLMVS